jgi:hypothetical protein
MTTGATGFMVLAGERETRCIMVEIGGSETRSFGMAPGAIGRKSRNDMIGKFCRTVIPEMTGNAVCVNPPPLLLPAADMAFGAGDLTVHSPEGESC